MTSQSRLLGFHKIITAVGEQCGFGPLVGRLSFSPNHVEASSMSLLVHDEKVSYIE